MRTALALTTHNSRGIRVDTIKRLSRQAGLYPHAFLLLLMRNFPTLEEASKAIGIKRSTLNYCLKHYAIRPAKPLAHNAWILKEKYP